MNKSALLIQPLNRRNPPNNVDSSGQEEDPGIYVCLKLTQDSQNDLISWCQENSIPNCIEPQDFHVTTVWSPKNIEYQPDPSEKIKISADTYRFKILGGCLVLCFSSPELLEKWKLAKELGAQMTFPTYKPHITLTYDPGDFDWEELKPPHFDIVLTGENRKTLAESYEEQMSMFI